ncbi:hypothetical protein FRC19_010833 [Serendipita sp. 401]|nr:hypothetical protein FRC19_010833 [Serendipita sp. 401]
MSAHTRAVTTMHLSSSPTSSTPNETQSPLSPSHSRSLTTPRLPPSPGHSLRLTPSIVMSRPAWPLPPLPPMPHPTSATSTTPSSPAFASDTATSSFASDTAAAAAAGAVVGGNDKGKGTRGRGGSLFRISPPMRSMTGPTIPSPSSAATETDDSDFRARRSASVNLDLMPSLSVMGETEQDDPDDDELGNDDEDEDEESDEVAREEMEIIGRPSIDSVLSMDSIASTDTVRAPPPPPTTTRVDVSAPSPSTPTNTSGSSHPLPTIDIKGKGKAKATSSSAEAGEEEGEGEGGEGKGSGSDSDDSLYFDARDSILLSSKEAAKVFERRQSQRRSQIYAQNPALAAALLDAGRERERERRLSTWSVSTASGGVGGGRESVYLTPMEGTSAFMTPTPAGYPSFLETVRNDPQFAHQVNAALLSGAGDKRSSVPAGFGLPSGSLVTGGGLSGNGGLNARRGGENRFSMSRLSQGGRAVDLSTLKFDPNSFGSRTPSLSGSTRRRVSSGGPSSGSALPDGLPPSRREGLPNFDSAKPYTTTTTTTTVEPEKAKTRESSMEEDPRTPHASDYFGTRARYSVHAASPSNHRRRGSVTASVSVPAAITEGVLPAADDDATSAAPDAGMKNAPVGSPSTTSQQKTPISAISSPMTPVMGTIKGTKRPSVYRQASRSMVDLSTSSVGMGSGDEDDESNQKINPNLITDLSALAPPLTATPAVDNMAWLVPPPSPMVIRPSMAKRQSTIRRALSFPSLQSAEMPSVANEPPPPTYESIPRREEEGKEVLPRYSNDIILAALVPRKVEFDRPGVQARDRRWNKVWCVLHGTMFKIYKVGTLEVKFGVLSTAPVAGALPPTSASTILSSGRTRQPTPSVSGRNPSLTTTGPAPTISEATESSTPSWKAPLNDTSQHAVLTRNQPGSSTLAPPFAGIPSSPTPSATSGATRSSGSSHMTSRTSYYSRPTTPMTSIAAGLTQSHLSLANTCPQPQATGHGPNGRSLIDNGGTEIYSPSQNALLRQYTLQNAESGLATDYVKRRNVIRVRLEGEQFLMQLAGVEEVVSWIEGFQAASNVALDLDERPMPRGPIYPRRRRRRRVRVPGELPTQSPLSPTNVVVNNAITTSSRSNS